MLITTKITFKEYFKFLCILSYSKWTTILVTVIAFLQLIFQSYLLFQYGTSVNNSWPWAISGSIFLIANVPISVYLGSKKYFYSNARLQETIEYEFTPEELKIKGETFNSNMGWSKTNRIEEKNDWFLIYQSQQTANMIPKKDLSEAQIIELRNFFKGLENVKTRLKA